ncbi:STY4851/ECs_5259 family protein [Sphingobium sp. WCS2017Hpa-17]|uniref:STY4851/ECs_5259 family protein n=1 Tax=Sphingobium sp. WCS2017Hpa-17 TaxID=3073638 RepID=UPI00288AFBFA|nr:STY4851/ECs_5259 family protein [Sphingobium sp. WCS2017Hpa-17]
MSNERLTLSLRIDEEQDFEKLRALAKYAAAHNDASVRALRIKALNKVSQLRGRANNGPRMPHFAANYGISETRQIPLHGYRLSDEAYDLLQANLSERAARNALGQGDGPGLFVLWAADWFRRCYRGDGLKWKPLIDSLGASVDQTFLGEITEAGLRRWGRKCKTGQRGRYLLGTLAREGGFPVAALEQGGKGWAGAMLAGIVAPLLADPLAGLEQAKAFARMRQERITARLFQDDEFTLLCAELALAVVDIRRATDGPARAAGLPVAGWLKMHRPDWRETLPLSVTGPGAEALLGELLLVEAAEIGGTAVGVERLLVRGANEHWNEAARLGLDGHVDGKVVQGIDADVGRLRLFAAGALARNMPGELGMLEPPTGEDSRWTARSRRAIREILPVPFATPIEMDIRSGERWIGRIIWKQGKPRRGELLVCTLAAGTAEAPERLKVEGSGSGLFKADLLVLQAPTDWRVTTAGDGESIEEVAQIGPGVGDTLLWRVKGGAFVTAPDGDCYRVRAGQTRDRRDRLAFIDGKTPHWVETAGDADLFLGPPIVKAGDQTRGGLFIRTIGSREWSRAPSPLPVGHYDIGWRDGQMLLDRRRIAVLPATARVERSGTGTGTSYTVSGFGNVSLTPAEGAPVRVAGDQWISLPPGMARPRYRFDATIRWSDGPPLLITIGYPADATIAHWDGTLLPHGMTITLDDLRELVAVSEGESYLLGELGERGPRRSSSTMHWQYHAEMPMSSVAEDIASLLLPATGDASVRLSMIGTHGHWDVRPFAMWLLRQDDGGLVASAGVVAADARICGRSLADPTHEVSFGTYSLLTDANHRPFHLPADTGGGWIIYLREGDRLLSRPEVVMANGAAPPANSALTRAMQITDWHALNAALHDVLIAAREDHAIISELNALAASLNGILPWYILAMRLLPEHPAALARMAVAATPEQRDAILGLSNALPFAWCLIPRTIWWQAFDAWREGLIARMPGVEGAGQIAFMASLAVLNTLVDREPLLAHVLKGDLPTVPRADVNQILIRKIADSRTVPGRSEGSRYREEGLPLPDDHLRLPDDCLETLDAPYAAALAVNGAWVPNAQAVRHIKAVARAYPMFFADAFAAALKETQ